MVGCSDFLVREPVGVQTIDLQLANKAGVLAAINGAYVKMRDLSLRNTYVTYGDQLSGNLGFSPNPGTGSTGGLISTNSTMDLIYNFADDASSSKMNSFYEDSYAQINNINLILEHLDTVTDMSSEEKNEAKAELLTMRALTHFQLAKIYSQNYTYTDNAGHPGIVYNQHTLKVGVDYPERKTVKETFALLRQDLDEAMALYQPNSVISGIKSYQFASKTVAKTIAAEAAIWQNDWQAAYDLSTDVIQNSGISLASKAEYPTKFAASELILDWPLVGESASPQGQVFNYTNASNYSDYVLSKDVLDLFAPGDSRLQLYTKVSLKTKIGTSTQSLPYYFPKKFNDYGINGLVYRLSEIYFFRAEAALHLGNTSQALADLNVIRQRAGLAALANSPALLEDILTEKRREFAYENKCFFDLVRNHKNIVRNQGCISTNCSPTYPNDHFILPIPASSVQINSNMKQNPGY